MKVHGFRFLVLVLALALTGCSYAMVSGRQIRPEPLLDVAQRTSRVRGLPVPDPLPAEVIERAELPDLLRSLLADEWSDAELSDYQAALTTVGVWPNDRILLDEFVGMSEQEVAGLYAPKHGMLYIVNDAERPLSVRFWSALVGRDLYLEFVLSHEIVHLLQHRRYPWILDEDSTWKTQDDMTLAVQTAIEGDAMRYGIEALSGGAPLPEPEEFRIAVPDAEVADDSTPALLRLTLTLPYVEGYRLAHAEGQSLLEHAPASTEQALHDDKRYEAFAVTELASVGQGLSDRCQIYGENTLGEVGISVLFQDLGEAPEAATWEGWHGDRYLSARCGTSPELFWWTAWDSERDADEFADAYDEIAVAVSERAGFAAAPHVLRLGTTVVVSTPAFAKVDPATLRTGTAASAADLRAFFDTPYRDPHAPVASPDASAGGPELD